MKEAVDIQLEREIVTKELLKYESMLLKTFEFKPEVDQNLYAITEQYLVLMYNKYFDQFKNNDH